MKGNRQGFLSRSITRRSDQNSKIKYCFFILLFCRQLVGKVRTDFSDKLRHPSDLRLRGVVLLYHRASPAAFSHFFAADAAMMPTRISTATAPPPRRYAMRLSGPPVRLMT